MCSFLFIVISVAFFASVTNVNVEATMEIINETTFFNTKDTSKDKNFGIGNKNNVKSRRESSYFNNPIVDLIFQITRNGLVSKNLNFFDFLRDLYNLPEGIQTPLPEYDFVIIGAGSGGSALASRLTENRNTTVLLIEAGKPEMLLTDIPAIAAYFQSTDYAWQYYLEHQPGVCMGMENERCFWPRGNAVGGSSVINYMIYTHGRPQDWDRIAAAGNYGCRPEQIPPLHVSVYHIRQFITTQSQHLLERENQPTH